MKEVLMWSSILLWIVYGGLLIYREILRNEKTYKKNNVFHLIRLDSVLFLGIYLFYYYFAKNVNFMYLFTIIVITNIVYLLYDLGDNYQRRKIILSDILYFLIYLITSICLIVAFIYTKNYILITIISLIINIIIPLYIYMIYSVKRSKNN